MKNKLDLIFQSATECREKGYECKTSKKNVSIIYKPDAGIKDKQILKKLFRGINPKLCDCALLYNKEMLAFIEIKCGRVTNSLLKDTIEKLENSYKVVNVHDIEPSKYILLYKQFENTLMKKKIATLKIYGIPLIAKKYENKAIDII